MRAHERTGSETPLSRSWRARSQSDDKLIQSLPRAGRKDGRLLGENVSSATTKPKNPLVAPVKTSMRSETRRQSS